MPFEPVQSTTVFFKVLVPSPVFGPQADIIDECLASLGIPVDKLESEQELLFEHGEALLVAALDQHGGFGARRIGLGDQAGAEQAHLVRAATAAVATPCWPAPVSAMIRSLPIRLARSTWPTALLILWAPV